MVSSQEKNKFLRQLFENCSEVNLHETQWQLHQLLMRDTIGGKLYKYRAFDTDGFSLLNLSENTLHCSLPATFNDPFDCKLGVTFNGLYKAKYNHEFDLICQVLDKAVAILHNELDIISCTEEEQRIIKKLFKHTDVTNFLLTKRGVAQNALQEEIIIKEHAVVILTIMQIMLEDESFSSSLGICASMIPQIMQHYFSSGNLYFSENGYSFQDFAKANGVFEDVDEIDLTMRLSTKINPLLTEAANDVQQYIKLMDEKIAVKGANMFRIGCLCTDYKNRLMWSHYADSHKGFCIEYDYSSFNSLDMANLPMPVCYSTHRPLMPWEPAFDNSQDNINQASLQILLGLLTKDEAWSYENEWRILVNSNDCSKVTMPSISCVYLGVAIEDSNKELILQLAKEKGFRVKQMAIDRGEYALHAIDIC